MFIIFSAIFMAILHANVNGELVIESNDKILDRIYIWCREIY